MAKRSNVKKIQATEMEQDVNEAPVTEVTETEKDTPIELSKAQQTAYADLKTKSAKIRYLHGEGFNRSQIAKFLNIRYQHVRNVLTTELKRKSA